VMAVPRRRGVVARMRGSLLDELIERLDGVDFFLMGDRRPDGDGEG
jgi:hypothetical protein